MSARKAGPKLAQHRAGGARRQRERIDADIGVLAAIELQNVELHDAVDGGDQNLASAQGERFVRGLEIGIADGIEHDVGAVAAGQFTRARCDIRR